MKIIATILFLTLTTSFYAQTFNQFDAEGKRHGTWRKYFDKTKELRYQGQFTHGKEIGEFKFYVLNRGKSVLSATKVFNELNTKAEVKFLSSKGKLISEGQMNGKLHIGKWVYYHNKSNAVMSTEYYNDKGKLDGEKLVFYPNGKAAEKANYINGKLEGASIWYTENGKILKVFQYKNDELNGLSKYYDANGNIKAEGVYRSGLKHGIWKYYTGGKLVKKTDHTKRSKNPKKQ
ncbi:preprotein translocase YidC [Flavobacteriales bacterium 33_180_T64]|nr:preprotein translocase YidC [Flavobacteriales bacterium 33_180_T64]